jgi:hypothetical protein
MKLPLTRSHLIALVAASFLFVSVSLPARAAAADPATNLLAHYGTVPLLAAGPYVERGTARVQVAAKLGRPDAVLPDGSWVYHSYHVVDSAARGTLLVRFRDQRVAALLLATPAKIAALRHAAVETARGGPEHRTPAPKVAHD